MVTCVTVSGLNWNLEMLVFVEGGKPEYQEKNPRSMRKDENQQQPQPTYGGVLGFFTKLCASYFEAKVHSLRQY